MRLALPTTLALLALAAAASPAGAGKEPELIWGSWDAALRKAGGSGRPVLVNVYTDWCGWCRRMDRDVYSRADVREYLSRRFVTARLNAESEETGSYGGKSYTARQLAAHFRVSGYPTTIFLGADGAHLVNVPGYVAGDRFLLLLRYIGDGHFERGVRFDDFVKRAAKEK